MSVFGKTIASLYFEYESMCWHEPGCPQADGDQWQVTRHVYYGIGSEDEETTLRFLCEQCGSIVLLAFKGIPEPEFSSTDALGFGAKPERVAGLWLHPGPRLWEGEEHGHSDYYVTRTKDRPRTPEDVAGVVGFGLGPRGGIRWRAGLGANEYGRAKTVAEDPFKSRPAAVKWITEHLDEDQEVTR